MINCRANIFLSHNPLIVHFGVFICFKRAATKDSFQDGIFIDMNGVENLSILSAE